MELAIKENEVYMIPYGIYKNTYKDVWKDFLIRKNLINEYMNIRKNSSVAIDYIDFINKKLTEGVINRDDISKELESALTFGKHRGIQIYDIDVKNNYSKDEFISDLNSKYDVEDNYNELARLYQYGEGNLDTLAYFKIISESDNLVEYVRLIFVTKVKVESKDIETKYENSYFPIDIDLKNKKMIVKYYDKEYLIGDYRGEIIANNYAQSIINIFDIDFNVSRQTEYQKALYSICDNILNSVINEKSRMLLTDIDSIVQNISEMLKGALEKDVDVESLNKKYNKNIFDINYQMYKLIENICISKIIYESTSEEIASVEGLISYITYKESSSVRAVIKNPKKTENLLDSQSYLNLRNVLDETKYIEEIKVLWNRKTKEKVRKISVKYDATKFQYISIKFYHKYTEEDLEYVRQKFKSFC